MGNIFFFNSSSISQDDHDHDLKKQKNKVENKEFTISKHPVVATATTTKEKKENDNSNTNNVKTKPNNPDPKDREENLKDKNKKTINSSMYVTNKEYQKQNQAGYNNYYVYDKSSSQNINANGNCITQMDWNRDMFVCILNSNKNIISKHFGHKCVCVLYVSLVNTNINQQYQSTNSFSTRLFMIDLFVTKETNKNILAYTGPFCDRKDYTFEKLCPINASMDDVIKLANKIMVEFGDYNYLTNNCHTFANKLFDSLSQKWKIELPPNLQFKWKDLLTLKDIYKPSVNGLHLQQQCATVQFHTLRQQLNYHKEAQIIQSPAPSFSS